MITRIKDLEKRDKDAASKRRALQKQQEELPTGEDFLRSLTDSLVKSMNSIELKRKDDAFVREAALVQTEEDQQVQAASRVAGGASKFPPLLSYLFVLRSAVEGTDAEVTEPTTVCGRIRRGAKGAGQEEGEDENEEMDDGEGEDGEGEDMAGVAGRGGGRISIMQ